MLITGKKEKEERKKADRRREGGRESPRKREREGWGEVGSSG